MTVLVTGGAGYIGSHMALKLGDSGERTVVLDNLITGFDWAVDHRATFVQGDAGDSEFVGRVIKEHGITEILSEDRDFARFGTPRAVRLQG